MTAAVLNTPTRGKAPPNFTTPFVNSVRNVFAKMVKIDVTVALPHEKTAPEPSRDVSAIIVLTGEIVGSVVVSFDQDAAIKLVEAFSSATLAPTNPDFADAIGELANMIVGGAKKDLGLSIGITVPNVIIGKGHYFAQIKNAPCLVIPCTTHVGNFAVEISIKQKPQGATP